MIAWFKGLDAAVRMAVMLGAIGAAILLAVLVVHLAGGPARRAAAEAKVTSALSASRAASGAEATETIAQGAARDAAGDKLSQENSNAILAAPGAAQRLDPDLNRAGLAGLCQRRAYRGSAQCVQFLGPVEPSAAGSRR